eukprot:3947800-Ditylum_brightwellii.AAC.1
MKDLLLLWCPIKEIVLTFILQEGQTTIQSRVWEHNLGALILGNIEPGCFTPGSKHFRIKYHWFRSKLKPNDVQLLKDDSPNNQSNILSKGPQI